MTRYIQRHSLLTRVTHGVAAITCILLAVTGLFVFWPELGGSIMGGEFTYWMRMLHRVFAIPFILVPLYAVFKSPKGAAHLFKEDIFGKWDKDDYKWAMLFPFYLFAPSKIHMPPQHHVKSAQRLADGALVFFCIIMALTGLVLWLNTGLLPNGGLLLLQGGGLLLIGHFNGVALVVHGVHPGLENELGQSEGVQLVGVLLIVGIQLAVVVGVGVHLALGVVSGQIVALHDLIVLGGLGLQLPIDAVHVFRVEQPALHIHEGPEGAPPPRIDTGIE